MFRRSDVPAVAMCCMMFSRAQIRCQESLEEYFEARQDITERV